MARKEEVIRSVVSESSDEKSVSGQVFDGSVRSDNIVQPSIKQNLGSLIKLAGPVVLTYILQYTLNLVSLMFIGQLSTTKLAGAAMGITAANITG